MRQLYRVIAAIVLATLTLNIAHATTYWCGYSSSANITSATQLTQRAQGLTAAASQCLMTGSNPIIDIQNNAKSSLLVQLSNMAATCNTAAKATSLTDPSINACLAAYACLKQNTQVTSGNQLNVCLQPNASNQTCTVATNYFYNTSTKACQAIPNFAAAAIQALCKNQGLTYNSSNNTCNPKPPCPAPQVMNASTNSCVSCSAPLVYSAGSNGLGSCVACPAGQSYLSASSSCGVAPAAPIASPVVAPSAAPTPAPAPAISAQAQQCANTYGKGNAATALKFLKADVQRLVQNMNMGVGNMGNLMSAYNAENPCCTALNNNVECPQRP